MRWQTWVLASLLLGSSAGGQAVESPAGGAKSAAQTAIFGHWRLVGASVNVPVDCRHSMLHITPDGYLAEQSQSPDGELFSFRAKAKIRQEGSRYLVTLGAPQHNGKPDCAMSGSLERPWPPFALAVELPVKTAGGLGLRGDRLSGPLPQR